MFFSKAILFVVSLAAVSVMATPHALNHIHHRAIATRAPPQPPSNVTIIARAHHRKRQNAQKCRGRTSTSSSVVPSSATSSISPQPTHTPAQHHAAVTIPESSPPPTPSPTPTPTSQPPAPTTSPSPTTTPQSPATTAASSGSNSNGFFDGTNSGDITFYKGSSIPLFFNQKSFNLLYSWFGCLWPDQHRQSIDRCCIYNPL
jgi:hypothetical protein